MVQLRGGVAAGVERRRQQRLASRADQRDVGVLAQQGAVGVEDPVAGDVAADQPEDVLARAFQVDFLGDRFDVALGVLDQDFVGRAAPVELRVALELVVAGQRDQLHVAADIPVDPHLAGVEVVVLAQRPADADPGADVGPAHGLPSPVGLVGLGRGVGGDVGGQARGVERAAGGGRREADALRRHGVGLVAPGGQRNVDRERVGRLDRQRGAAAIAVDLPLALAASVADLPALVAVLGAEGQAALDAVGDRTADIALEVAGLVVADLAADRRLEVLGRLAGDEVDQAGGGVAAIERALRPLQHLDPLQVVDRAGVHHRIGVGDLVGIGADGRGGRHVDRVEADPAQGVGRHPLIALRDAEAGREGAQVLDVGDVQLFQGLAGDGLDAHADGVGGLFPALGGDDDRLDLGGALPRRLGRDGRGRKQRGRTDAQRQQSAQAEWSWHVSSSSGAAPLSCACGLSRVEGAEFLRPRLADGCDRAGAHIVMKLSSNCRSPTA